MGTLVKLTKKAVAKRLTASNCFSFIGTLHVYFFAHVCFTLLSSHFRNASILTILVAGPYIVLLTVLQTVMYSCHVGVSSSYFGDSELIL